MLYNKPIFLVTLFSIYLIWYFQDRFSSSKTPRTFIKWLISYFYNHPENKINFHLLSFSNNLKKNYCKKWWRSKNKSNHWWKEYSLNANCGSLSKPKLETKKPWKVSEKGLYFEMDADFVYLTRFDFLHP